MCYNSVHHEKVFVCQIIPQKPSIKFSVLYSMKEFYVSHNTEKTEISIQSYHTVQHESKSMCYRTSQKQVSIFGCIAQLVMLV
jgi:hypothetical protein